MVVAEIKSVALDAMGMFRVSTKKIRVNLSVKS
jgi:hypothetical protein